MTEELPKAQEAVEPKPEAAIEVAIGFATDEAEDLLAVIESRREQETSRPGVMRRLVTSAKARMAMTVVAAATAIGGASAEGAEQKRQKEPGSGRTGRAAVAAVLEGVQRKVTGGRWEDVVVGGVGAGVEHYGREKAMTEQILAERARAEAHEAERFMREAEYKLRRIEAELPRLERSIKAAQYEVLKLAATDPDAQEVRAIMMKRTALKIELWKAAYTGDEAKVEELSAKDAELEESLIPHLRGRVAQRCGDIFVRTIIQGELKILDLEGQQGHLRDALGGAGRAFRHAMTQYQAHAERAQRAYDLAGIGARIGYGRY